MKESLKKAIYFQMQRSLFVKHKILFSLMMSFTVLRCNEEMDDEIYNFMLSGLSGKELENTNNPDTDYFSEK